MSSEQRTNPTRPDFLIDAKLGRGNLRPRPWTEQPQGCGRPGYGIHVPQKFFELGADAKVFKESWEIATKGRKCKLAKTLDSVLVFRQMQVELEM